MTADREKKRLDSLQASGLLELNHAPIWDEAVRTVAHFLDLPICFLGFVDRDWHWLKASTGWLDLDPNHPQVGRFQIAREESFCTEAVERQRVLAVRDTAKHPTLARRVLVQHYGIRAYLGVPLVSSRGDYLGTIAAMDLAPRSFRPKEIEFVKMAARWTMREVERAPAAGIASPNLPVATPEPDALAGDRTVEGELIGRLLDELRTPLTSVMGMTSVLYREVYGPLRPKQKEYANIIHNSGQYLLSLVEEILALKQLQERPTPLEVASVDLEMVCQEALKFLEPVAKRKEQQIHLSVNPLHRIGNLDKGKAAQLLYHLVYRVVQMAESGCTIRIHAYRERDSLNFAVWVSHPWLGDSLPDSELELCQIPLPEMTRAGIAPLELGLDRPAARTLTTDDAFQTETNEGVSVADRLRQIPDGDRTRERLGLLLSCRLAELHGGSISIQGSARTGYRYVVSLPMMELPSSEAAESSHSV